MKAIFPVICLLLATCGDPTQATGVGALVGIGSIAAIGRTPVDAVWSLASGRDCSVVRLEKGQSYCREPLPPPEPPPFCTRSLGRVDCWKDPASLPGHPVGVADGPDRLTPAQERERTKGWLF
jgi:hypothetical protein